MSAAGKIYFNNENSESKEFSSVLNRRVNDYFKDKGISKFGNSTMYFKTLSMLAMYFVPYLIIVILEPAAWIGFLMALIMGLGMSGIGLSIMHDAIHGSYSSSKWVNTLWGYTLNVVGGNAINWKIQHNVKHHTYTNIEDHDEDISPKAILRFSPGTKKTWIHKYQYIYAWFFYALGTFFWVTFKDFFKFFSYYKEGLVEKNGKSFLYEFSILLVTKVVYYTYIFGVPIMFTSYTGGQIAIAFFGLHFVAGMGLAIIFQPAHLMEEVEYPAPDENGNMKYSWIIHQLYTTINFANKNRFLEWYAGGLNFQIEHHLFPHICHVHYKDISEIVKKTTSEFQLPYYSKPTLMGALSAHTNMLKWLGTA